MPRKTRDPYRKHDPRYDRSTAAIRAKHEGLLQPRVELTREDAWEVYDHMVSELIEPGDYVSINYIGRGQGPANGAYGPGRGKPGMWSEQRHITVVMDDGRLMSTQNTFTPKDIEDPKEWAWLNR